MNATRKLARFTFLVLLALLLLSIPSRVVFAHAEYDHSEPAADAVVEIAPSQVRVWFTQELFRRQGENSLEVYGADGRRVDQNDLAIDDDDRSLMTISLTQTLAAGVYTVRWAATSAEDGHQEKGEFAFTIGKAESATSDATPPMELSATATTQASTAAPTPTLVAATPTGQTPNQGAALPCLGGSVPMVLLGAALANRRQIGLRKSKSS